MSQYVLTKPQVESLIADKAVMKQLAAAGTDAVVGLTEELRLKLRDLGVLVERAQGVDRAATFVGDSGQALLRYFAAEDKDWSGTKALYLTDKGLVCVRASKLFGAKAEEFCAIELKKAGERVELMLTKTVGEPKSSR